MSYTGVFLTPESRDELLAWCAKTMGPPIKGSRVIAEHMTIKFRPSQKDSAQLSFGSHTGLRVVGFVQDKHVQAVVVSSRAVRSANLIPHITVCVHLKKPAYSNEALTKGFKPVADGPWLVGEVSWGSGKWSTVNMKPDERARLVQRMQGMPPSAIETQVERTLVAKPPPQPVVLPSPLLKSTTASPTPEEPEQDPRTGQDASTFTGVFLTSESRAILLSWAEATLGPPLEKSRVSAKHMVISRNPPKEQHKCWEYTALRVVGYVADPHVQAVVVSSRAVRSTEAVPHITLCVRGQKASYAILALSRGWTPVHNGPWLVGEVNWAGEAWAEDMKPTERKRLIGRTQQLPASPIEAQSRGATEPNLPPSMLKAMASPALATASPEEPVQDPYAGLSTFTGVFLTDESRALLLSWAEKVFGPLIERSRVSAKHMVISRNPTPEQYKQLRCGSHTALRVVGYVLDKHVQAVVVSSRAVRSTEPVPHITVCLKGQKTAYASEALARGYYSVTNGPWLVGEVNWAGEAWTEDLSPEERARLVQKVQQLPLLDIETQASGAKCVVKAAPAFNARVAAAIPEFLRTVTPVAAAPALEASDAVSKARNLREQPSREAPVAGSEPKLSTTESLSGLGTDDEPAQRTHVCSVEDCADNALDDRVLFPDAHLQPRAAEERLRIGAMTPEQRHTYFLGWAFARISVRPSLHNG